MSTQLAPTMTKVASEAKGITFGGHTFAVPPTHDMVKALFDPLIRKSVFEIAIIGLLASNTIFFWLLPDSQARINVFVGLYVFWRLSYNFGIGYMLNQQSNHNALVKLADKSRVFDKSNRSSVARLLRYEVASQMGPDYDVANYPIEFSTWLIFRKAVDLILMLDFTTFMCLVVACAIHDDYQFLGGQLSWLVASRLVIGGALIVFNFWVKVNAHNIIKDYAWYWGDFFFRQINNEELIFDGVFEMVPHPMYSVGYVGYYGFALIAKSYTVLTVALFGHFLQMIFLHYIENPHIDKIYGPSDNDTDVSKLIKLKDLRNFDNAKPLVGLWNFNWLRSNDIINLILITTYAVIIPLISSFVDPSVVVFRFNSLHLNIRNSLFVLTVAIKLFESFFINTLLLLQSYFKTFTKWYLSNNILVEKSLNNWSIIFNTLINLTYASFIGLNLFGILTLNVFASPDLFFTEYLSLRIFVGLLMIVTQIWINASIIDLIGYFGWFYGDFFIPKSSLLPQRSNLTKAGIYRYLNNPEQIFGVCGVMGLTLIIPNFENLTICFLWVANNFFRINFIEKLHMIKVYGELQVLVDSGVIKTFKKHLLPEYIQKLLSLEEESAAAVPGSPRTKNRRTSSLVHASDSLEHFLKELRTSKAKLPSLAGFANRSGNFENSPYKISFKSLLQDNKIYYTYIGSPIEIAFEKPEKGSETSVGEENEKDWIGLYKIVQTSYSRTKTLISSQGRWNWVENDVTSGTLTFGGEKLFWEEGVYEFRYHLKGKHDVVYISQPFEIKVAKIVVPDSLSLASEFANELKEKIFNKYVPFESIEDSIFEKISQTKNVVENLKLIAYLISSSTGIKINSKFLIYDIDENAAHGGLNIKQLSLKLINIRLVLNDLSNDFNADANSESLRLKKLV